MATGQAFVAAARTHLGERYSTARPVNCSGGYVDCSALIVCAARAVGVSKVPTNSSGQAIACRDAGTLLSIDRAYRTPGALLFRGPNKGYWGYGSLGHVAISLGDGAHTVEARGKAYGCVIGPIANRSWSNAGMLPGITNTPAPAPTPGGPKVPAEYNPPPIIQSMCLFTHPTLGTAAAMVAPDGAVYCKPSAAYMGGMNGNKDFAGRIAARIDARSPHGYQLTATSGETYVP